MPDYFICLAVFMTLPTFCTNAMKNSGNNRMIESSNHFRISRTYFFVHSTIRKWSCITLWLYENSHTLSLKVIAKAKRRTNHICNRLCLITLPCPLQFLAMIESISLTMFSFRYYLLHEHLSKFMLSEILPGLELLPRKSVISDNN